jgi:hypothetical protein
MNARCSIDISLQYVFGQLQNVSGHYLTHLGWANGQLAEKQASSTFVLLTVRSLDVIIFHIDSLLVTGYGVAGNLICLVQGLRN